MVKKRRRNEERRITKELLALKKLRLDRHLSVRRAARKMGKSASWLNHLENGRFDARACDKKLVLESYGVTFSEFEKIHLGSTDDELIDLRSECLLILKRLPVEKLKVILPVLRAI